MTDMQVNLVSIINIFITIIMKFLLIPNGCFS